MYSSAAGRDGPEDRHPRQRATRACTMCHSRKVKCDALNVFPCTRCKNANLQCTLRSSRRRQPRPQRYQESQPARIAPAESSSSATTGRQQSSSRSEDAMDPATSDNIDRAVGQCHDHVPHSTQAHGDVVMHVDEKGALAHMLNIISGPEKRADNRHLGLRISPAPRNSSWSEKFLSRCNTSTRIFLADQGVFKTPRPFVADSLLRLFFDYVHPHIPVVEKAAVVESCSAKTCSPLLLNCIFFIASHFADASLVESGEWQSKSEMSRSFFEKARLIADFDLEYDQITLIQSYLLLSQSWQTWAQERNARYWIGRATNVAMTMGLFRQVRTMQIPEDKRSLWNRVSVLLLVYDASVATGVGAPLVIADESIEQEPRAEQNTFAESALAYSSTEIDYMITSALLGQILRDILRVLYSARAEPTDSDLIFISSELEFYDKKVPHVSESTTQDTSNMTRHELVLAPLLRLKFLYASLFYHRQLVLKCDDQTKRSSHQHLLSSTVVEICNVMSYLNSHALCPFCPGWVTTTVFHTITILFNRLNEPVAVSLCPVVVDAKSLVEILMEGLAEMEGTWNFAAWIHKVSRITLTAIEQKAQERRSDHNVTSTFSNDLPLSIEENMPLDDNFIALSGWDSLFPLSWDPSGGWI